MDPNLLRGETFQSFFLSFQELEGEVTDEVVDGNVVDSASNDASASDVDVENGRKAKDDKSDEFQRAPK